MRRMRLSLALVLLLFTAAFAQLERLPDPILDACNAYYKAMANATAWTDVLPYISRDSVKAIEALTPDNRDRIFVFYQKLEQAVANTGAKEVKDAQIDGDKARVFLQIMGARPTDDFQGQNVNLTKEVDGWKVDISRVIKAMGQ